MKINYITGNSNKIKFANLMLNSSGIEAVQKNIDIHEIQADVDNENRFVVAIDKAKKAFEVVGEPLFVTDTIWEIPALNNFPGAYMKYVNK